MDAATPVDAGAPQKSAAELVPGMPVLAEPVETIVDDPTLQLQSTEVIVRVRVPRDSDEEVLRVTGYRSMDYETGMSPTGESALLNRVVELPLDQNEIRVELELAPMLYYQATVGEGEFLFGAGLLALVNQDRMVVAGEGGVDEAGEGADPVEHARVGGLHALGHFALGSIGLVDIDAGAGVGEAIAHWGPFSGCWCGQEHTGSGGW